MCASKKKKKERLTQIWVRKPADNKKCWVKHSLIFPTDWNEFTLLYMNQLGGRCINLSPFFPTRLSSATDIAEAITSTTPTCTDWIEGSGSISTAGFHFTHHNIKRVILYRMTLEIGVSGSSTFHSPHYSEECATLFLKPHVAVTLLGGAIWGHSRSAKLFHVRHTKRLQNAINVTTKPHLISFNLIKYQRGTFFCIWGHLMK